MADYWIKLYLEILDDPKVGLMSEWLFARMVKLFLVAKEHNKNGKLPPIPALAWRLRMNAGSLSETLLALGEVGVVRETSPGDWLIVNFAKRQGAVPGAERTAQSRKRERNETLQEVKREEETSSVSVSSSDSDFDSSDFKDVPPAAVAYSAYQSNNGGTRNAERLYQKVTGQLSIPSLSQTQALTDLQTLVDYYGTNWDRAVAEGQEVFGSWCARHGKNGKPYSPVNTAWLGKWLEKIAPLPGDPHESSFQAILNKARKEQEAMQKR